MVSALTLGLGGCALEKKGDLEEFRQALPTAGAVAVDGPETTGTGGATRGTLALGPGAEPAEWYTFTRNARDGVNFVTAVILGSVNFVVHTEPTELDDDRAVWGPYPGDALDPVTWRLTVNRIGEHHYAYVLDGQRKGSSGAFLSVLRGEGYAKASEQHGDGAFTLDLDNAKILDPSRHASDSGTVTIEHELPSDIGERVGALPRFITARIDPGTGDWLTIQSSAFEGRTGSLDVTALVDIDVPKDGLSEDVTITSRWLATGAGRSDIVIAEGSVPAELDPVRAVECWGEDFSRVFYEDSVDFAPSEGEAGACAFPVPAP